MVDVRFDSRIRIERSADVCYGACGSLRMNTDEKWNHVLARDNRHDGTFFYGVRTTGVYCRPSCPSRRPKRESVEFFGSHRDAEHAGYRPCKRCKPTEINSQLRVVRLACQYIEDNSADRVRLFPMSASVGVSPYYLQRLFKRILGVTPHEYHELQRMDCFKAHLGTVNKVTDAIYEAGYGSSSRLYEKTNRHLGMTPKTYQNKGEGTAIGYTVSESDLGKVLIAATRKGICSIRFGASEGQLSQGLHREFSRAAIRRDDMGLSNFSRAVMNYLKGSKINLNLPIDVQATAFQHRVWRVLRAIPYGETRSYGEIAQEAGDAKATRAVARACATNPVGLAIPCHRVIRKGGHLGGYRWGLFRKQALLKMERPAEQ